VVQNREQLNDRECDYQFLKYFGSWCHLSVSGQFLSISKACVSRLVSRILPKRLTAVIQRTRLRLRTGREMQPAENAVIGSTVTCDVIELISRIRSDGDRCG
jgi:hypothetical protein